MTKKATAAQMEEALRKIAEMDLGVSKEELLEMSNSDALDVIVTFAHETLNPVEKPSALELKTQEVRDFVMKDFRLAFASNDDICEALNKAGIFSPTGKEWTRSNVSKIMSGVKDLIVMAMGSESEKEAAGDPVAADEAPESVTESVETSPVSAVEEAPGVAVSAAQPVSEPVQAEPVAEVVSEPAQAEVEAPFDEALLAELDGLEDLENVAA